MGSCGLQLKEVRSGIGAYKDMGDNGDSDIGAEEILEMSTEKLDEMSERKKKNSLLNEVLVTGLLKNINEKVSNKLDTDAQSELISIINERVKDGYKGEPVDLESEIEKAISFDEEPTDDHIISNANKNRAKLPANRRLPTKESKLSFSEIEEQIDDMVDADKVDEDFDNLFNDDNENEANQHDAETSKDLMEKSYIDDFDALLEDSNKNSINTETDTECNVDDDFDALLMAENIQIDLTTKTDIPKDEKSDNVDIKASEGNNEPKEKETKLDTSGKNTEKVKEILDERMDSKELDLQDKSEVDEQLGKESSPKENNTVEKNNINDSLEDIFKNLENNETNLVEIENMLLDDSLDKTDSKTEEKPEITKDPFDDLFDELDEENLDDVDKGFEQIYENKKITDVEEKAPVKVDIDGNVLKTQNSQEKNGIEVGTILDIDEEPGITDTIGTPIVEDEQDEVIEEDMNVIEKDNVYQGQGVPIIADEKQDNEQEFKGKEITLLQEIADYKMKVEQLEKEKEKLQNEIKVLSEKQGGLEINKNGKKVIVPTENHDQEQLDEEIRNDTREAELLIQLKHLSERVEVQDTLLAETKEDNTVLRIQNQNLLESLNKANATSKSKKKSFDTPSLDWIDNDDSIEKKRLFLLEQELEDQKEVNKQLKAYVGDILINIIVQNPQILEKKQ